jgi:cyclopropane-fatty-acyl-phospholipid synthase
VKLGMNLLANMLERFIKKGTLRVIESDGTINEFKGSPLPVATMRLHDPTLPLKMFRNPELHTGEAYMDGTLTFEDCTLEEFLNLFSINRGSIASYPMQKYLRRLSRTVRYLQQHNPIGKAQKNVAHHYDLSAEMYRLFLDKDLHYSCAYFENGDETLEEAQKNKMRHIAAKLRLEDGQRILDIGCGWGGMAFYLAQLADVEVLGVTLSEEQYDFAVLRAGELGLSDRVHFELQDYRHVNGRFDRIVSIGMFEHVGVARYDEFFGKIFQLLTHDGFGLLHSIGHMSPPSVASPWIRKYIFPGAYSPALSETFAATERQHLWVSDVEVQRVHYADTLVEWNKRFQKNRERIAEIYDERFCRMWEFYLLSAETMFRTGAQMVFQMQLSRIREATGLTRDYMFEADRSYKNQEPR